MKNFADLTKEELWKLRKEVILDSVFTSDFTNSFCFNPSCVSDFFNGYSDFICELIEEDGLPYSDDEFAKRDTAENLYSWFNCSDDLSWVEIDESCINRYEVETKYKSGVTRCEVISGISEEDMWDCYDRHHDSKKIEYSAIVGVW